MIGSASKTDRLEAIRLVTTAPFYGGITQPLMESGCLNNPNIYRFYKAVEEVDAIDLRYGDMRDEYNRAAYKSIAAFVEAHFILLPDMYEEHFARISKILDTHVYGGRPGRKIATIAGVVWGVLRAGVFYMDRSGQERDDYGRIWPEALNAWVCSSALCVEPNTSTDEVKWWNRFKQELTATIRAFVPSSSPTSANRKPGERRTEVTRFLDMLARAEQLYLISGHLDEMLVRELSYALVSSFPTTQLVKLVAADATG